MKELLEINNKEIFHYLDIFSSHLPLVTGVILVLAAYFSIRRTQKKHKQAIETLKTSKENKLDEPLTLHPLIDPKLCAGCGACVTACPEGEILQRINHKAVLVNPTKCVGHGACEQACPFGAIDLVFGTKTRGMDIPRVTPDYETNVAGIYIAGELGGMGLVKNAIKQGRLACEHACSKIKESSTGSNADDIDYDLFIVGAGPAGFSASLAATQNNLSYRLIDQNTFGGTVYNFPRQKIVTSHPLDFAMAGQHKFKKNVISKEELLRLWTKIKTKFKIKISEKEHFESLNGIDGNFKIKTSKGEFSAKKILLCMGLRGTPRKLDVAGEELSKVTYNLLDPSQYQNSHIAIVGGGNSALEAAQYLAKNEYNNHIELIVRGDSQKGLARSNQANQDKILQLKESGKINVSYSSSITNITKDTINLKIESQEKEIKNDFVFVFAGALMPFKFLMGLGISIDKCHGVKKTDKEI